MREKIDCFLPCSDFQAVAPIIAQLRASKTIQNICLLTSDPLPKKAHSDWQQLQVDNLTSSNTLMSIAENAKADYVLLQAKLPSSFWAKAPSTVYCASLRMLMQQWLMPTTMTS